MISQISKRPDFLIANEEIAGHMTDDNGILREGYTPEQMDAITALLGDHNTLMLRRYSNGGASAVTVLDLNKSLEAALGDFLICEWTRDSAAQGLGELFASFDPSVAAASKLSPDQWKRGLWAMLKHYEMHQGRFWNVIKGNVSGFTEDCGEHPAVRFNPVSLREVPWHWSHTQNDAHGMLLGLLCYALNKGYLRMSDPGIKEVALPYLTLLFHYWRKTCVWAMFDFGAWEDIPAEHQSSLLCVAVGLELFRRYLHEHGGSVKYYTFGEDWEVYEAGVQDMLDRCVEKLHELGTNESIRPFKRTADLAQLNGLLMQAVCDVHILDDEAVDKILANVELELRGTYGFRRYIGDVWDGREHRSDINPRKDEAQWFHGLPTVCVVRGEQYRRTGNPRYRAAQVDYFNRSLGGVTADWFVPEARIVDKATRVWVDDHNSMLAWGQSMLVLALCSMKETVAADAAKEASAQAATVS